MLTIITSTIQIMNVDFEIIIVFERMMNIDFHIIIVIKRKFLHVVFQIINVLKRKFSRAIYYQKIKMKQVSYLHQFIIHSILIAIIQFVKRIARTKLNISIHRCLLTIESNETRESKIY